MEWGLKALANGNDLECALEGIDRYEEFLRSIRCPNRLSESGMDDKLITRYAEDTLRITHDDRGFLPGRPPMSEADLEAVLRSALQSCGPQPLGFFRSTGKWKSRKTAHRLRSKDLLTGSQVLCTFSLNRAGGGFEASSDDRYVARAFGGSPADVGPVNCLKYGRSSAPSAGSPSRNAGSSPGRSSSWG